MVYRCGFSQRLSAGGVCGTADVGLEVAVGVGIGVGEGDGATCTFVIYLDTVQ